MNIEVDVISGSSVEVFDCNPDKEPICAGESSWQPGDERILLPILPYSCESMVQIISAIEKAKNEHRQSGLLILRKNHEKEDGVGFLSIG